jgi:hypothetical protein
VVKFGQQELGNLGQDGCQANQIIVGFGNGGTTPSVKPFNNLSCVQRKFNLHEISVYDFIQDYSHQLEN